MKAFGYERRANGRSADVESGSRLRIGACLNGPVPKELGRLLKRAEEIRLVADYKGDSVEFDDAREMVEQAEVFVDAMRTHFTENP